MRKVLTLTPIALVVALLIGSGAYSAEFHRSTGLVVKVDPARRTLFLSEEGHPRELVVGRFSVLFDSQGRGLKGLEALQVGDYVYEDCIIRRDGQSVAREIRILRSAWRMLESPRILGRSEEVL